MLKKAFDFLNHLSKAQTSYQVHSPSVYEFVTQILPHDKSEAGDKIDALRKEFMKDESMVLIEDHGAGYGGVQQEKVHKKILEVTKSSARTRKEGELLYRICKQYQPKRCLELGTNMGFSTLYQLAGLEASKFITVEGASSLAKIAAQNFKTFGYEPSLIIAEFDDALNSQIDLREYQPDYVFMDGNHQFEPTMRYFYTLLPHMTENSMLILDDINWSSEMSKAWKEMSDHPEVSVTIDLFYMGICILKKRQAKEHFKFRFYPI